MTYKFAMLGDIQFCGYCHFYIKSKKKVLYDRVNGEVKSDLGVCRVTLLAVVGVAPGARGWRSPLERLQGQRLAGKSCQHGGAGAVCGRPHHHGHHSASVRVVHLTRVT